MGARTKQALKALYEAGDRPSASDFADLIDSPVGAIVIPIAYTDASGNAVDVNGDTVVIPADNVALAFYVARAVAWDALTSFTVTINGTVVVDNTQHNLTGAAPDVETVAVPLLVTANSFVVMAWNQGAATQGEGFLIITYVACTG